MSKIYFILYHILLMFLSQSDCYIITAYCFIKKKIR